MSCSCSNCVSGVNNCLRPKVLLGTSTFTKPVNVNGFYTLGALDDFAEEYSNTVLAGAVDNILDATVKKYGDSFYEAFNTLNNDFFNRDNTIVEVEKYPILEGKIVTPFEFAQFLNDFSYTPISVVFSWNSDAPKFVSEINYFYQETVAGSVMGSFCDLMPNIFGAVKGFFTALDKIGGLLQDAFSFLAKINNLKNPLKALFDAIKVKALIEAVKKKIKKAFEGIIDKVKNAITNFDVGAIIGNVTAKIASKFRDLKTNVLGFFSEENVKRLTDKIQAMVDFTVGLFENPSIGQIMYMISRFCKFISGMENLIGGLNGPIVAAAERHERSVAHLRATDNEVLSTPIAAGRQVLSELTRQNLINNAREADAEVRETNNYPARIGDITQEEIDAVPKWDDVKNNTHPLIGVRGGWLTEKNLYAENGGPIIQRWQPQWGWNRLKGTTLARLMRLQDLLSKNESGDYPSFSGKKLIVNSPYRTDEYQANLRRLGKTSAINGMHQRGIAFDITWSGFNRTSVAEFRQAAFIVGFPCRVPYYGSFFVHIDEGRDRIWPT
jgi:hypothetical protein